MSGASRTGDYFSSATRCELFTSEAGRWLGTPFIPHAAVRGAGVDCVNLGREIYRACGLTFPQSLPNYSMDGGKHNPESQLIAWLEASGGFRHIGDRSQVGLVDLGDTLCFKIGRSAHHTGFSVGGTQFVHCLFGREVMVGDLRDKTFLRCLAAIYRPLEVVL